MKQINSFTQGSAQNLTMILDGGSKITFSISYFPNQSGWFYSFTYGDFTVNNRRLVTSPNMIRQFRGFLPFGFAVTCRDGNEPVFIDDFVSGRVQFYLLDQADVAAVEAQITAYGK